MPSTWKWTNGGCKMKMKTLKKVKTWSVSHACIPGITIRRWGYQMTHRGFDLRWWVHVRHFGTNTHLFGLFGCSTVSIFTKWLYQLELNGHWTTLLRQVQGVCTGCRQLKQQKKNTEMNTEQNGTKEKVEGGGGSREEEEKRRSAFGADSWNNNKSYSNEHRSKMKQKRRWGEGGGGRRRNWPPPSKKKKKRDIKEDREEDIFILSTCA